MNWYYLYLFKPGLLNKTVFFALIYGVVLSGCSKFFEKNIEDELVQVLVPLNEMETYISTVNFQWEEMDGATAYRLQIAEPSFDAAQVIVVDTLLSDIELSYVLYPGQFEWRIRGENGSSHSEYVKRSFRIDSTLDLSNQLVVLYDPLESWASNADNITFAWSALYNAEEYEFVVRSDSWGGPEVVSPVTLEVTTTSLTSLEEGVYFWGVRAMGNGTTTAYVTRSFQIDRSVPALSELVLPSDGSTLSSPVLFSWSRLADTGSAVNDSLFIYTDEGATEIIQSMRVSGTSQAVSLLPGTYYWRIKSVDAADNESAYSVTRDFLIEN